MPSRPDQDREWAISQSVVQDAISAVGAAPLIALEGVSKSFGTVRAVDRVSLAIGAGEFLCLLGPSGCGKTTLLRLLGGFEMPDAGRILLDGRDLAGEPPERRPTNTVFQSYALFPHMSVAENVGYGLRRLGLARAERDVRIGTLLRRLRLEEVRGRRPSQISGGQAQRTALARALAREPRVLLLDEPLGALDRRLREETQAELKALQAELGTTFVMVTHDQEEAMRVADRIVVMENGRPAQIGTPQDVYNRPASRFVASFLGDVNIFEGCVLGSDGRDVIVVTSASDRPLRVEHGDGPVPDGSAVAVRPEKIAIAPRDGTAGGPNSLDGTLAEQVFLGGSVACRVVLARGQMIRVLRALGPGVPAEVAPLGSPVRVSFPPSAAVLVP